MKTSMVLVLGLLLFLNSHVAFAADGDLVVNGNVGVGTTTPAAKMDVNGEMKMGNSGLACSSSTAGAMRYNSANSIIEYCNGATWTTIGGTTNKTWQMIWSTDVTTATSSITAAGLNGDADVEYRVIARVVNSTAMSDLYVRLNGDSNNYGCTGLQLAGTVYYGGCSGNGWGFWFGQTSGVANSYDSYAEMSLYASSGRVRIATINSTSNVSASAGINSTNWYHGIWKNTSSNITNIVFVATATNGIGVGSHFEIWAKR